MYRAALLLSCMLVGCGPEMQGGTGGAGGSTQCGGHPTDTNSDVANCGGCGQHCPAGLSCVQGSCSNDPEFSIGGISAGSPDSATVAGQVWVVIDVAGLHAAAPGTSEA